MAVIFSFAYIFLTTTRSPLYNISEPSTIMMLKELNYSEKVTAVNRSQRDVLTTISGGLLCAHRREGERGKGGDGE